MRAYLPGNRLQHLFKSEKPKNLQLGPPLSVTARNRTCNKNAEVAELSVLRPSYSTRMTFINLKAAASKLLQRLSHLPLTHCLFICLPERGNERAVNIWIGLNVLEFCNVSDLQLCRQWPASLGQNSWHDATLSFTFLVHSCQLTQQHEAANPVLDLLQLHLLLQ